MSMWTRRREPRWDDRDSWSFSMVGEFFMHDRAHCRGWYGGTFCLRHAQDGMPADAH